jgi:chitosanase
MINKKIIFLFLLILICITGSAQAAETDTMSHTYQTWLQMNTCWENPDQAPNPYWGYAENIGDGRGITCGFIGFCTGTGDANEVVKYYTTLNPSNVLAKYIPALNAIDAGPHNDDEQGDGNDDLTGLTNFINDWEKADRDDHNTFALAQLHVMDEIYWTDTVSQYTATGCQHPVSLAIMASINTRFGNDGLQSCVSYAKSQAGGTPGTGKNEKTFDKYMSTKFKNLGAGDDDTTRIDSFIAFTTSGNNNLNTPFQYTNDYGGDVPYTITGDLGLTAIVTPVAAFTN